MYAVIFRATMAKVDEEYYRTAKRLRDLAINDYGCVNFVSMMEGNVEIAISYWETEAQIAQWKNDPIHKVAQAKGRQGWYESYSVEVCKVERAYGS